VGTLVVGQLARRLGLPLRSGGSFTTSKRPDAQAMQESVVSMLSAVQGGANFILHSAGFLDGLLSVNLQKFVLDADFCGALHSYLAGVQVDDNQLAVDAFAEVGPGNHFLGCSHTLANYTTAFFDSQTNDNEAFETWSEAGGLDAAARATLRVEKTLAAYEPPPLDAAVDEELQSFIAQRKAGMTDQWY
jgi:trimethylamine--corrinoid protein Co-methyltransferase